MFRLIAVTLAAIFGVLYAFGDEANRPEVAREARAPLFDFSLAAFVPENATVETTTLAPLSGLSEAEAVKLAIEAGQAHRDGRNAAPAPTDMAATTLASAPEAAADLRYVSGELVNLRSGPGTGNEVVAQLPLGTAVNVITDTGEGWAEIRTSDGSVTGWMSARFLSESAPG